MNWLCVILGIVVFLMSLVVMVTGGGHIQLVAMLAGFAVRDSVENLKEER